MTVSAAIRLINGRLMVSGESILTGVHDNVVLSPVTCEGSIDGAFLGVDSDQKGSHRIFPVGKLQELRFLSLFRCKLWWMTQWMGNCGKDIPVETQFLIIEAKKGSCLEPGNVEGHEEEELYVVFLPILEGDFRSVLQGNEQNEVEICLESGDPSVDKFDGSRLVFIASGTNPFSLITDAVKTVAKHLQTFCHRERRTTPDMLNWFGWCTWDAFYTSVSAEGVKQGIESLTEGGFPPKFLILDDGWQTVGMDPTGTEIKPDDTANYAERLLDIKENMKFQGEGIDDSKSFGLRRLITDLKEKYAIRYIYVWHAIMGYWAGVNPYVPAMEHYGAKIVVPSLTPGVQSNVTCHGLDGIVLNKVGLVDPDKAFEFYNDLHTHLLSAGVDGIKVDGQTILETLGVSHGGRVSLARKYHEALGESVSRNFKGNEIISCMSQNTDTLYLSGKKTAIIRASDDFFPNEPASHTIQIASVAYNSIFLGEFMQPDWDMFHSRHPMAEFHGAARAVGGGAVYVSDKPGNHDFHLLKKLVLPDGSILRAKLPGRPTRDCLFMDPTRYTKSLLKVWNLNEFSGVIGVFNCQGASWCRTTRKNILHDEKAVTITGYVSAKDIEYLSGVADDEWDGDAVVYSHREGELHYVAKESRLSVMLEPREYEVFTVVPVKKSPDGNVKFAEIGLLDMFNSGGAIADVKYATGDESLSIQLRVRGCGKFGAYSSTRPKKVMVDSKEVVFGYDQGNGLFTIILDAPEQELYHWSISILF